MNVKLKDIILKTKEFEICGVKDNKTNIENHLKSCALMKLNCLFCKEDTLRYIKNGFRRTYS